MGTDVCKTYFIYSWKTDYDNSATTGEAVGATISNLSSSCASVDIFESKNKQWLSSKRLRVDEMENRRVDSVTGTFGLQWVDA